VTGFDATLVFDVGPEAGLGHRRRMEALGDALTRRGFGVTLTPSGERVRAGVVVCDSYASRADDLLLYRADRVVAVDDLDRDLAVDLVVDPSPGSRPDGHRRARGVAAGPRFALVDPAICDRPVAPPRADVERVLVATGGADAPGVGGRIARALAALLPAAEIRVAVGPWGRPAAGRVVEVRCTDGLVDELADADLVVSAGGVTLVEALALGRPTVALALAGNQRRAVAGAVEAGAAIGATVTAAASAAADLARDHDRRRALFDAARRTVDGLGAARVADEIVRLAHLVSA
jgi:spore coat polysaccharide biosynthesis predicted glycosyltransferase SpsG